MKGLSVFKLVDIFGVKIALMHKNETKLVSRIGGITTTVYFLSVLIYLGVSLNTMFKREEDTINTGM